MSAQLKPAVDWTLTPDGVAWFVIYDYGFRQEGLREGTGSFLSYRSTNADGVMGDWVLLNGGLLDRTPGKEQGDLDMIIRVDGAVEGISLQGNMTAFGGMKASLVPTRDRLFDLGGPSNRWGDLWLAGLLGVTTIGKQIYINGVPQWIDCIPVNTQQGVRYIPTFAAIGE